MPRDDLDMVSFSHVTLKPVHKTSGASETIFMKLRSRNSRATGPKMRVPRGFKSLSIITIALLSKRSREPSSPRIGGFVRTRTARTTCRFLLVVRIKFFHLFDNLAELGMRHPCDGPHDNRLVHAARNHFASARLARTAGEGHGLRRRLRRRLLLLGHKFTFSRSLSRAARAVSQSGQRRAAANATCLAARAGHSAVANADAGSLGASRVSSLATRPYSFQQFLSFSWLVRRRPHGAGSGTSCARAIYPQPAAEIRARPIQALRLVQTKCCPVARWRPRTRAGLCLCPCAFPAAVP